MSASETWQQINLWSFAGAHFLMSHAAFQEIKTPVHTEEQSRKTGSLHHRNQIMHVSRKILRYKWQPALGLVEGGAVQTYIYTYILTHAQKRQEIVNSISKPFPTGWLFQPMPKKCQSIGFVLKIDAWKCSGLSTFARAVNLPIFKTYPKIRLLATCPTISHALL